VRGSLVSVVSPQAAGERRPHKVCD
jgi:hypothetical protein